MNVANGYWLPILRRRGIPILTNVDGIEWDRAKWGRLAKRVFYTGAKLSAHFSTGLVFDAAAIANRWRREFKRDGVIIPYGGEPPVEELPVEPGLTHRGYALFVARFVPENTVFEFLMAAEVLCQQYDVVMVGSSGYGGEIDAKVADLAKTNSRFHWFGHISDDRRLDSLWQHAGAYFHGHSVGGTNPSLVQAMACGAPIVARDTVFTREVLDDCAIFIPPQIEAIRSAIAQLLTDSDRQKSLSDRAQARARTHYTWEQVNEGYASALRDLVSGSFVKS
jgi:glycosyltransferase involved in cell wall biosynthesis